MIKVTVSVELLGVQFNGEDFTVKEAVLRIKGAERRLLVGFQPPYVWDLDEVQKVWEDDMTLIFRKKNFKKIDIDTDYLLETATKRAAEVIKENLKKRALEGNHVKTTEIVIEEE